MQSEAFRSEKRKRNMENTYHCYANRELSWLRFNERVLEEAEDSRLPLCERLSFLSIFQSNLDEFFMVRIGSLVDMIHAEYTKKDIAGMSAKEQLDALMEETHKFAALQYSTYNRSLVPALKQNGLRIVMEHEDLTEDEAAFADEYFHKNVYPVLTPMAFDSSRPFPLIRNKTLNIGALLSKKDTKKGKEEIDFATVQVPSVLPRVVIIPSEKKGHTTVTLLEQIIERNIDKLFLSYDVICAHPYRIMRNADLPIDEDEAEDLLVEIQKQLKKRQWGEAIRLEVEDNIDKRLLKTLRKEFNLSEDAIFKINGPLDLTFLMKVYDIEGFDHLKEPKYIPQQPKMLDASRDLFEQIREHDILLHHPYETFDPVVNFVKKAASDPNVLAIKQTLYRVSSHSPIIASLAQAAENGKQVSVLVELKARFDEENNIVWAKKLEKAGCHVIYGLVGLKTHSKITLVVRKEEDEIRRYVHLGTGNYNDSTAKLYTDMGMFTSKTRYGEDATAVFNMLSGYSEPSTWNKLVIAPIWLRKKFLSLIQRETRNARAGREARIVAKMNSLCDQGIIAALYEASAVGVKIDLVVRGICCLIPGVKDATENIRVISIVGRFLEHSRIYIFGSKGREKVYIASADYMTRNTLRRVEVAAPVCDPAIKERLLEMFRIMLNDNQKARHEDSEGNYRIPMTIERPVDAQETFYQQAYEAAASKNV